MPISISDRTHPYFCVMILEKVLRNIELNYRQVLNTVYIELIE